VGAALAGRPLLMRPFVFSREFAAGFGSVLLFLVFALLIVAW
jgi:hypothetical protein